MYNQFKSVCSSLVKYNDVEWEAMEKCLSIKTIKKGEHFLKEGEICQKLGFITEGSFRLYFLIEGEEVTKDFCFENEYTGSVASFSLRTPARFNVVAMEDSRLVILEYEQLHKLYAEWHCWSNLGRILMERFGIRKENREISFLLNTPEQRYLEIIERHPLILQKAPLKQVASYLGITPETLSRIRNRIL